MRLLAADIGGTYSRIAWQDDHDGRDERIVLENARFGAFEEVLEHALQSFGTRDQAIDRMALAVPGPVHSDPVVLTNIAWTLSRAALKRDFGVGDLTIANDFQAAALGAVLEPFEHLKVLNPGTPDDGPVVVAGAGTGLGMSWLPRRDLDLAPHPTEGGHVDFAPQDDVQRGLFETLSGRFGHVSYERILSGDGLVDAYTHIADVHHEAPTPRRIHALAGRGDEHAVAAVRLFGDVFAAYAGNLALSFNPTGGIYLCGGLAAHLAAWFDPPGFQLRFAAKGRMADTVKRIPVFLVTRHNTGLAGAIRLARQNTGQNHEQH
jgi:glucokinase